MPKVIVAPKSVIARRRANLHGANRHACGDVRESGARGCTPAERAAEQVDGHRDQRERCERERRDTDRTDRKRLFPRPHGRREATTRWPVMLRPRTGC